MGGNLVTTVIAVLAALLAAFCFARGRTRAADRGPRHSGAGEAMRPRLLLDLAAGPAG